MNDRKFLYINTHLTYVNVDFINTYINPSDVTACFFHCVLVAKPYFQKCCKPSFSYL